MHAYNTYTQPATEVTLYCRIQTRRIDPNVSKRWVLYRICYIHFRGCLCVEIKRQKLLADWYLVLEVARVWGSQLYTIDKCDGKMPIHIWRRVGTFSLLQH